MVFNPLPEFIFIYGEEKEVGRKGDLVSKVLICLYIHIFCMLYINLRMALVRMYFALALGLVSVLLLSLSLMMKTWRPFAYKISHGLSRIGNVCGIINNFYMVNF